MAYPTDGLPPIHPGIFLRDDLDTLGLSAGEFAEHIRVPDIEVTEIVNGDRPITARMAIRLGLAFGISPQYWLNLQSIHDLKVARAEMPADLRIEAYA